VGGRRGPAGRAQRPRRWPPSPCCRLGAAVLLVERLGYLTFTVDYVRFAHDSGPLALTALQVAALAVACTVLAPISVRALRRTPPAPVPA
jgi:hypothetical protein